LVKSAGLHKKIIKKCEPHRKLNPGFYLAAMKKKKLTNIH